MSIEWRNLRTIDAPLSLVGISSVGRYYILGQTNAKYYKNFLWKHENDAMYQETSALVYAIQKCELDHKHKCQFGVNQD